MPLLEWHTAGCRRQSLPMLPDPENQNVFGKTIVYARRDGILPDTTQWMAKGWRDIPHPGGPVRAGFPICTVTAVGRDQQQCYSGLNSTQDYPVMTAGLRVAALPKRITTMSMKDHILTALREQFKQLEELFASLNEEQLTAPHFDDNWSIKDIVNHLWGWQQISIARVSAGVLGCEPTFPDWLMNCPGGWDEDSNQTNAWIYKNFHSRSWTQANNHWREGFLQLLDSGQKVSEKDLLDGDRYVWLRGYSLAFILIASYEHHQEHLEKLLDWLKDHDNK